MPKRDPEKQKELEATAARIRAEREAAAATPKGITEALEALDVEPNRVVRTSDVVPREPESGGSYEALESAQRDASSYDVFEAAEEARRRDARERFIDQTAIGLFVAGYPKTKIYEHAATLWELRAQWRKGQGL